MGWAYPDFRRNWLRRQFDRRDAAAAAMLSRNVIQKGKWRPIAIGHYHSHSRYSAPLGFGVTLTDGSSEKSGGMDSQRVIVKPIFVAKTSTHTLSICATNPFRAQNPWPIACCVIYGGWNLRRNVLFEGAPKVISFVKIIFLTLSFFKHIFPSQEACINIPHFPDDWWLLRRCGTPDGRDQNTGDRQKDTTHCDGNVERFLDKDDSKDELNCGLVLILDILKETHSWMIIQSSAIVSQTHQISLSSDSETPNKTDAINGRFL